MWTDDRVELLKQLWKDGLSGRQISTKMFGDSSKKNAVIGKIHRLGLSGRKSGRKLNDPARPRKRAAPTIPKFLGSDQSPLANSPANGMRRARGKKLSAASDLQPSIAEVGAVDTYVPRRSEIEIPDGQRVTLMQLGETTCRFPLWGDDDPDRFYCGAVPALDHVYCVDHCWLAYNSVPARLDVRPVPR